jgi:putative ABC transport system ATP-binding protein
MIELEGIQKTYISGMVVTPVLKDISFRVQAGEFVAIMGASGTGKSTLMNILGCLDKPTSGNYQLDGMDMLSPDDDTISRLRNSKIGFIFQMFHLLERTSALRNVMLPLIYAPEYPEDACSRAEAALKAVGLADRMNHRASQLSGGQQQRVAIARALIRNPALLLADEPTGNLDRRSGLEILSIFQQLHRQGRTILLITHDETVAAHAQRILVLANGTISVDHGVAQPADAQAELAALPKEAA